MRAQLGWIFFVFVVVVGGAVAVWPNPHPGHAGALGRSTAGAATGNGVNVGELDQLVARAIYSPDF